MAGCQPRLKPDFFWRGFGRANRGRCTFENSPIEADAESNQTNEKREVTVKTSKDPKEQNGSGQKMSEQKAVDASQSGIAVAVVEIQATD